jgi:hypothetical protein
MKGLFKLLLLFTLLYLTACNKNKKVKVPEGIIIPDSMIQVLTDVHIAEASAQMGLIQAGKDSLSKEAFDGLYKKHHITEADYHTSLNYYLAHPSLLDSVYDKVLNNLSQQKAEMMGKKTR